MLYLALSCLQGQPAYDAAIELTSLEPGIGLQLTPGCAPTEKDPSTIQCPKRTHHGYTPNAMRTRVWNKMGELLWTGDTLHPPMEKELRHPQLWNHRAMREVALETMYPGYAWLNAGDPIERYISHGYRLVVDVSHLAILARRKLLSPQQCNRIFAYDNIVEVHVSRSTGHSDSHMPLTLDGSDFGIGWAKERLKAGTPVVMEMYMHRLSVEERKQQIGVMLG